VVRGTIDDGNLSTGIIYGRNVDDSTVQYSTVLRTLEYEKNGSGQSYHTHNSTVRCTGLYRFDLVSYLVSYLVQGSTGTVLYQVPGTVLMVLPGTDNTTTG
jgi:hypothetical protein